MSRSLTVVALALVSGLVAGCADPIGTARPDAAVAIDARPNPTANVETTQGGDGSYTTVINSTSLTAWIHADFETGMEAASTAAWDLRFQRFHISTNGGVTGGGGVEVVAVAGTTFAALTAAPAAGYLSDAADSDGDGEPEYALERGDGWYAYNSTTHVLSPRPIVWVVKTAGGTTIKLEIVKYYDDAGTAGWFTLHWAPL